MDNLIVKYFSMGLNHDEILSFLEMRENISISKRTLKRRLNQLNLYRRKNYTSIEHLITFLNDELVKSGKMHGYKWMHLKCLQAGLTVQQESVRLALKLLDYEGVYLRRRHRLQRRQYYNKGPNFLWHVDSYDKLKPYGICINGCIDGFSRHIMWLKASYTNNDPSVIAGYFMEVVSHLGGCPKMLRADMGTENRYMEQIQNFFAQQNNFEHIIFMYGKSTANQRIEAWWSILRKDSAQFWMNLFQTIKDYGYYDGSFLDRSLIQYVFMDLIQVKHSMKAREKKLKVWIITKKDGSICTGHCTCMAGLGEVCSHIAAVLYAAESATNLKMSVSCTDVRAVWPAPSSANVEPVPVALMNWGKCTAPKQCVDVPALKSGQITSLLEKIQSVGSQAALTRIVEPFCSAEINSNALCAMFANVYNKINEKKLLTELIVQGNSIKYNISKSDIFKIEEATRGQQKSTEWYKHRKGHITASIFKDVCHTSVKMPSITLIKSICYPAKNNVRTKAISWGIRHEAKAAAAYFTTVEIEHENFRINEVGLFISSKWPCLGASPDRLIYCDCCLGGCIEIKCPYNLKDGGITLQMYAKKKDSCLIVDVNKCLKLNKKHKYYYQIQAQIFVTGMKYCDFIIWSPYHLFIERIYADEEFWEEKSKIALKFHSHVIMPELLGRYFTSKIPGGNITPWCFCGDVDNGAMVKCANEDCNIVYFHYSCGSLLEEPETSWICSKCNETVVHSYNLQIKG